MNRTSLALTILCTVGLLLLSTAAMASDGADEADPAPITQTVKKSGFFDLDHRWEIYEKNSKSSSAAVLYTLVFPGLGNMYAEQYFLGAAMGALGVFTFIFLGYGFATDQTEYFVLGGITGGIAYIGGGTTAAFGASRYNLELKRALKLPNERAAVENAHGLTVSFRF